MSPVADGVGDPARRRHALVVDAEHRASARRRRAWPGPGRGSARRGPRLPICWLTHSTRRTPGGRQAPAGLEARALLGLADVGQDAEAAVDVAAGVDRDDGDAGLDRAADRGGQAALGDRDDEPVGVAGDRLVDQRLHAREAVDVGRAVVDDHVHLARRGLDAVAHDGPERARRLPVGDDGDAHAAAGARRRPGQPRLPGWGDHDGALVHARRPAAAGQQDHEQRERRAGGRAPHAGPCGEGIVASRRVPAPGGLSIARTPSTTARRSCSPRSPLPALGSAPPTPSSATTTTMPPLPSPRSSTRARAASA